MIRVGLGTDKHRLGIGRPLIIGGVKVDSPKGAVGHSDADVLAHVVIDALLGAAGLGDIGHHFPDNDPQWKNANSIEMLKKVAMIVESAGFNIVNIDCSVHLERPKLGKLKQEMSAKLAEALGMPRHMVNVKAKSGEGLGDVGNGESVEAFAVALLEGVSG